MKISEIAYIVIGGILASLLLNQNTAITTVAAVIVMAAMLALLISTFLRNMKG